MRDEFPIQTGDKGSRVRDIHRKLASIKERLPSSCHPFLSGPCRSVFTLETKQVLKEFQKEFKTSRQDGVCDHDTWKALNDAAGSVFAEVWRFELDALRGQQVPSEVRPAEEKELIEDAHAANLAGLAFSGGGIRSATFNLGVLQALAKYGLLRQFDYLSTVSGGGYIGAWFSKWLKRENETVAAEMRHKRHRPAGYDGIGRLEHQLSPGTANRPSRFEAAEIRFLRKYSNYLTPKTGLFSADTWTLLATYVRNTSLNLGILAMLLAALLAVPRILSFLVADFAHDHAMLFGGTAAGLALFAVFYIAFSISSRPDPRSLYWIRGQSQGAILALVVAPLVLAAFTGSVALWEFRDSFMRIWKLMPPGELHPVLSWLLAPGIAYFGVWAAGWGLAQWRNRHLPHGSLHWPNAIKEGLGHFSFATMAFAACVALTTWLVASLAQWQPTAPLLAAPAWNLHLVTFGVPVLLSIFGLAMILTIGLVGRMYSEKSREWWSRQGGWTAICAVGWFGLTAISLYGPAIAAYFAAHVHGWTRALVLSTWFGTVATGLALGHGSATGVRRSRPYLEWIAALAPPLFSAGALLLVSTMLYLALLQSDYAASWAGDTRAAAFASYRDGLDHIDRDRMRIIIAALIAAGWLLALRVDINKFSLYMMYRNRLVRAYLGASNRTRSPHPFTGFDEGDDVHLDEMCATENKIQRPFHIINTALNLATGKELAWQTRKAAAFAFTPAFCGFELPSMAPPGHGQLAQEGARGCYRPTAAYRECKAARLDEETGVKLGMTVAISGAAVSPNMGYHSSPALAFLMTLFNVRLGRWFANPRRSHWKCTSPWLGIRYLLSELLGMSDADAGYLHLSDGGHFENLGIYELVRRRCRLIVVVDASEDKGFGFEDLGNAIRKCATDLQVEIDINVNEIECVAPDQFSNVYCVAGKILYEQTDAKAPNGTLLYIKPALLGTECASVLNYRKENADFPHQSTADQWFDETQFESYRALGCRVGTIALGRESLGKLPSPDPARPGDSVPALAEAIERVWGILDKPDNADEPAVVLDEPEFDLDFAPDFDPEPDPAEE